MASDSEEAVNELHRLREAAVEHAGDIKEGLYDLLSKGMMEDATDEDVIEWHRMFNDAEADFEQLLSAMTKMDELRHRAYPLPKTLECLHPASVRSFGAGGVEECLACAMVRRDGRDWRSK